jgi:hypothetical protein
MPFTPKGSTPELYVVPRPADNQSMKTAEDGGVSEFTSIAIEICERWGFDTRLTGELATRAYDRSHQLPLMPGLRQIRELRPSRHGGTEIPGRCSILDKRTAEIG